MSILQIGFNVIFCLNIFLHLMGICYLLDKVFINFYINLLLVFHEKPKEAVHSRERVVDDFEEPIVPGGLLDQHRVQGLLVHYRVPVVDKIPHFANLAGTWGPTWGHRSCLHVAHGNV